MLQDKKVSTYFNNYENNENDNPPSEELQFSFLNIKPDHSSAIFGTKNGSLNVLTF